MVSTIQQWRNRWGYWRLQRESSLGSHPPKPPVSLPPRTALILFEADQPRSVTAVNQLKEMWEGRNIQVSIIGYYPDRLDHPQAPYSYFNRKALDIKSEPQGEIVDAIKKKPVDVVIQICTKTILPLDWIAFRVPASIKIAPAPAPDYYGLQLDGHGHDPVSMILQADRLLNLLKTPAHAFA